jgi:hypothetical protein
MSNKLKVCPYDGTIFLPKRSNQIYFSNKNRMAFHNRKYKELRQKLNHLNKRLFKSYEIISLLIKDKEEIVLNNQFLLGKGFSFIYLTHLNIEDNITYYGLYDFIYYRVSDKYTKFFKNENYRIE